MIKNKLSLILMIAISSLIFQGCATIFTGTKSVIPVNSVPEGAKVTLNGIDQGVTPVYLNVKKTLGAKMVTIEKDGYQSESFKLGRSFQIVSVINFFNWIAWTVDIATGSVMRYNPKGYYIKLKLDNSNSNN